MSLQDIQLNVEIPAQKKENGLKEKNSTRAKQMRVL